MGFLGYKILGAIVFVDRKTRNIGARRREWIGRRSGAVHVTEIQGVYRGQIVIESHPELVVGLAQGLGGGKCIEPTVGRWEREKGQNILRNGIDRGQLVIRNRSRLAGCKTVELVVRIIAEAPAKALRAHLGKIALAFEQGRHGSGIGFALPVAEAFVIPEEKRLVFHDRPAKGRAELVLLQRLHAPGEVVGGIHRIVAQKLPEGAVKLIRTRTGDDVGGGTGVAPEFGIRIVGQDPELSDRVERRFEHVTGVDGVHVVSAVDQEIIRFRPLAIDRVTLVVPQSSASFKKPGG